MRWKLFFILLGGFIHIGLLIVPTYLVFTYLEGEDRGILILIEGLGHLVFGIAWWTFIGDREWGNMGVIENREDGTSIDHSQYGDYHFDEKGNLTTFRPVSKLNYLIQQVGVQKVIEMVGFDIVDEFGKYKIINLDLGGDRRYYLRMVNPSTKEIHYEGVPNDCNSVEKAIKWRNQSNELPEDLT